MDIPLDEVIFFDLVTSSPGNGGAADADSPPTFAVYEETTDTDIGVGGSFTKRTSLTGNYRASFTASAANGFEVGKWYSVIASATVSGVVGKAVVKNFRVAAAESVAGVPVVDAVRVGGTAQTGGDLSAQLTVIDGIVDDILVDTGTVLDGKLDAIAEYIDTEVAAIKAKTDNLPASPAATGDIPAADIAAIKEKTDSLTFTQAGAVDANIQYVNDVLVGGVGSEGNPWRPA